jgi:hypothetical protein
MQKSYRASLDEQYKNYRTPRRDAALLREKEEIRVGTTFNTQDLDEASVTQGNGFECATRGCPKDRSEAKPSGTITIAGAESLAGNCAGAD